MTWNDFTTPCEFDSKMSVAFAIYSISVLLDAGVIFAAPISASLTIRSHHCHLMYDLNGLLRLTSKGCKTDVQPPGIMSNLVPILANSSLTASVN